MPVAKGQKNPRKSKIDWDTVDWTLPNWKLAFRHNASKPWIAMMRKKLGKPRSPQESDGFATPMRRRVGAYRRPMHREVY